MAHWWKNLPGIARFSNTILQDAERIEHLEWEIGLHERAIEKLRNEQNALELKHETFLRKHWTQEQRDGAYGMRK